MAHFGSFRVLVQPIRILLILSTHHIWNTYKQTFKNIKNSRTIQGIQVLLATLLMAVLFFFLLVLYF